MTNWTVPTTWTALQVPTAALLDTHWRDNLLHLKETADGFGYPYAPYDPRLIGGTTGTPSAVAGHYYPQYVKCFGRGTVSTIYAYVSTSSGLVAWGTYANSENGWPGARLATSFQVTCPAIGVAGIAMAAAAEMNPRDWFGWAGTGGASAMLGGRPSVTGVLSYYLQVGSSDINVSLTDLPETADPFTAFGQFQSACFVGA